MRVGAIAALAVAAIAACADGDDRAGVAVWSPRATKMVFALNGGFAFTPPGSECPRYGGTYTMKVADRHLAWDLCLPPDNAPPFKMQIGQRTLSPDELGELGAALARVEISTKTTCPNDVGSARLVVSSVAGDKEYFADSQDCGGSDGTFVKGLWAVGDVLGPLAR